MQRWGWWQPAKRVNLTTIWRGGWHDREGAVSEPAGEGARLVVRDGAEGKPTGARRRNRVRQDGEGAGDAAGSDLRVRNLVRSLRRARPQDARRRAQQDREVLRRP